MNDLKDLKKHAVVLLFRNCPKDTREEHLADFLWAKLGINIPAECMSIKVLEPPFDSANCLVVVTKAALADYFARALESLPFDGRQLFVAQKTEGRA